MPQIVYSEFRDATSGTKYPFIDTASLTSNGANDAPIITLPNDLFIDLSIFIPGNIGFGVILSDINVSQSTVSIYFGYGSGARAGSSTYCVGTISMLQDIVDEDATIPLYLTALSPTNASYVDKTKRVGTVVMNKLKLAYFKGLPLGHYIFNPDTSTRVVPSCIVAMPNLGVTSISVNERTKDNTVSGRIWLVGHDGVFLRTDANDPNRIRIDVVGDNLYKKAALGVEKYDYAKPIRSINNVPADEFGGFIISTTGLTDALRVNTDSDGITMFMAGAINGN